MACWYLTIDICTWLRAESQGTQVLLTDSIARLWNVMTVHECHPGLSCGIWEAPKLMSVPQVHELVAELNPEYPKSTHELISPSEMNDVE